LFFFLLLLDWNVDLLAIGCYLELVLSWVHELLLLVVLGLLGLELGLQVVSLVLIELLEILLG
jgi:hypothetical protein